MQICTRLRCRVWHGDVCLLQAGEADRGIASNPQSFGGRTPRRISDAAASSHIASAARSLKYGPYRKPFPSSLPLITYKGRSTLAGKASPL